MMTGDSERTASAIAKRVGVDSTSQKYFRKIKQKFVENEKANGKKSDYDW